MVFSWGCSKCDRGKSLVNKDQSLNRGKCSHEVMYKALGKHWALWSMCLWGEVLALRYWNLVHLSFHFRSRVKGKKARITKTKQKNSRAGLTSRRPWTSLPSFTIPGPERSNNDPKREGCPNPPKVRASLHYVVPLPQTSPGEVDVSSTLPSPSSSHWIQLVLLEGSASALFSALPHWMEKRPLEDRGFFWVSRVLR